MKFVFYVQTWTKSLNLYFILSDEETYITFKLYISFCIPCDSNPWPLLILYHLNEIIILFYVLVFCNDKNIHFVQLQPRILFYENENTLTQIYDIRWGLWINRLYIQLSD